jgi:hypothetical protein
LKTINAIFKIPGGLILILFLSLPVFPQINDTLLFFNVEKIPAIDGKGDDPCWANIPWHTMNQVWIKYGETIDSNDYYGRFKVAWSSKENLLYFLSEITDDTAIGGFSIGKTADVYNYDIFEIFIDEDRSGGPHINDNSETGENAENAFAYHIYSDFPLNDEANHEFVALDKPTAFTSHIPDFALRKSGNVYTREVSLMVFNDTYENNNPKASRVILSNGKIMGLSLAYCDNDKNDGIRDNFFGSVWVQAANYNNHWMFADDFGIAKLISDYQLTATK